MQLQDFVELSVGGAEIAGVAWDWKCWSQPTSSAPSPSRRRWTAVMVLALIVAMRTYLSWSLALELDGRWPWQRAASAMPSSH